MELVDLGLCCLLAQQANLLLPTYDHLWESNSSIIRRGNEENSIMSQMRVNSIQTQCTNDNLPCQSDEQFSHLHSSSALFEHNIGFKLHCSGLPDHVGPNCIVGQFVYSLAIYNCQLVIGQVETREQEKFATSSKHIGQLQFHRTRPFAHQYRKALQFARHKIVSKQVVVVVLCLNSLYFVEEPI